MTNKILKATPIITITLMLIYTWCVYLSTHYTPVIKDWAALVLVTINIFTYFYRFKYGILFTGIILVLSTFTLIQLLPISLSSDFSFYIGKFELRTPFIEIRMLLLLIIFLILNKSVISAALRFRAGN